MSKSKKSIVATLVQYLKNTLCSTGTFVSLIYPQNKGVSFLFSPKVKSCEQLV